MPPTLKQLKQLTVFFSLVTSSGCATMYYLLQKSFSKKEYYTRAIAMLEDEPTALATLGAPPLKVHFLKLADQYNHVDKSTAQIKIPVSGSILAGNLCSSAVRDQLNERWNLQNVFLELDNGTSIPIYQSDLPAEDQASLSAF